MTIQIDSREKAKAIKGILAEFERSNVGFYVSKLYVGDYMNLDNPRLVIDRKQNLSELCSNVCQEHERFRAELMRAQEHGIQIVILCEHGGSIKTLEDVIFWQNPRSTVRKKVDGRWINTKTRAMTGERLYKVLKTMGQRYGVRFEFCDKRQTGRRIMEILKNDT